MELNINEPFSLNFDQDQQNHEYTSDIDRYFLPSPEFIPNDSKNDDDVSVPSGHQDT